ncbi:MAG: hypothetical protein KH704_13435 [Clostridiales bacterium]|nr:hypothetical protein [Clostridiales bacterium]
MPQKQIREEVKIGEISKNEFYAKYANKRDKGNIRGAAVLAYGCAAISLAAGILIQNYLIVIDVALIVGFALGIQIAKSRACAVLLLVYSCTSMILTLVSTGRVTGLWLILVGVWAVMGTFHFHKDYQKYRSEMKQQPLGL